MSVALPPHMPSRFWLRNVTYDGERRQEKGEQETGEQETGEHGSDAELYINPMRMVLPSKTTSSVACDNCA